MTDTNTLNEKEELMKKLIQQASCYADQFNDFVFLPFSDNNVTEFENVMSNFVKFLFETNSSLPGPVHPTVAYFRKRKKGKTLTNNKGYSKCTNPQRSSQRRKKKISDQYKYDLAQWQYANQRRKVAQTVLNATKNVQLKLDMSAIELHFKSLYETPNDMVRDSYEKKSSTSNEDEFHMTLDAISLAIKKISIDTSPGPDGVVLRTIRNVKCDNAILAIAKTMLSWNYVPLSFRVGRTILIYKGKGDDQDLRNWRAITIFNVLRRIIERSLDQSLRERVRFSQHQRGFVVGMAGTHINASIVDGCLRIAKEKKKDCCIAMLDLSRAFDVCGHNHIRNTLQSQNIPNNLCDLVISLATGNSTKLEINKQSSNLINLRRGVAQGAPLSPTLFNLCQDFVLKLITDPSVAMEYGFEMDPDLCNVVALAFADDTAIIAKDTASAVSLVETVKTAFHQVGMSINPSKSVAINIVKGSLHSSQLILGDSSIITSIKKEEKIRYLGVNFSNGIVFDKKHFLIELEKDFRNLVTSPLLRGDQKMNILNQYVFPKLVYPMQTTPVDLLETPFLDNVDSLIRQGVREVVGLPSDTPIPVYYSRRNVRGLGLVKVSWEAPLQHINICQTLMKVNDPHLHLARNLEEEMSVCKQRLAVSSGPEVSVRSIRTELRSREFQKWTVMPQRGIGIKWFQTCPATNKWVSNKDGLTSSEWTNGIKLSMNSMSNRATGGRSAGNPLCRNPTCREMKLMETIPHIRGVCPRSENLRNSAHHKIRSSLAHLLKEQKWEVYEEVHCEATLEDGSKQNRRADIVAIDRKKNRGMILDPTLRWETNNDKQDSDINEEKRSIYVPTIPYFQEKYGISIWNVIGLWFGVRGSASPLLKTFFTSNNIQQRRLQELCLTVMKDTLNIVHRHLYSDSA